VKYPNKLNSEACEHLLKTNILPFWIDKMVDHDRGGFYGRIDGHNRLHQDAPKGIILNSRILWTFSSVARQLNDPDLRKTADRAYHYILDNFIDTENGGVFWMLDASGNPVETKKQVYAQAFTIYALSEYYRLSRIEASLDLAKSLFEVVEKYSFDKNQNGYLEAFDAKWSLLEDLRLSDKDANEAKTMNTHLHVLEAYTNLFRVWRNDQLSTQLKNLIQLFLDRFIDKDGHFHLFFDENWKLKSDIFSFGHDIEGGWLLYDAALVLGEQELMDQCKAAAIQLTDAALEGMDTDHGLMNEGESSGVIDSDKHWWPQAEALVGLINTYQLTGNSKYFDLAQGNWDFILTNLIDPVGEWYWMVDKVGVVNKEEDKAGPWKCPYHNGRAMVELIARLRILENQRVEI
jgi:mannobiose 2-epimerase